MNKLLVKNIGLLATPLGSHALKGPDQGKIHTLKNAWVLMENETILALGEGDPFANGQLLQASGPLRDPFATGEDAAALFKDLTVLDAEGALAVPGLVDAHTHLIFAGWRQHEMGQKLHGATYLDILRSGGGILSTVRATRKATFQELYDKATKELDEMLTLGVTTAEAKSGYGLDRETEIRQLEVVKALHKHHPIDLVPTYLGAHALPEEYKQDREGYLKLMIQEVLPEVAKQHLAKFCDVFCEKDVFTAEETKQILLAGKEYGLIPKIHADEIEAIGGTELSEEVGAISCEHLIKVKPSGMEAMAKAGTVACLLPATSFYLGATYAPARAMIDANVAVAIATDFNPGSCPSLNIQLAMNLACLKYKMTPEEMLTAVTLNGAAAIGMADTIGSLEVGKQADLVLFNAPDLDYLGYRIGSNLVKTVIKKGRVVVS